MGTSRGSRNDLLLVGALVIASLAITCQPTSARPTFPYSLTARGLDRDHDAVIAAANTQHSRSLTPNDQDAPQVPPFWVVAWSLRKALRKAARRVMRAAKKVARAVRKVFRVAQELAWRAASIFDFAGSLIGIRPRKHAGLKVFVLFDENDTKQTPVRDLVDVEQWVHVAKDVFESKMNIRLHPHHGASGKFVHTLSAPTWVLTGPRCNFAAGFKDRADWFEDHTTGTALGYGGTMYVFVVRTLDVPGDDLNGCAWPWIHNFCLVDAGQPVATPTAAASPKPTTLAHELGHLCGIFPHSAAEHNLMNVDREDMDSKLNRLQKSAIRTARYVTYINV